MSAWWIKDSQNKQLLKQNFSTICLTTKYFKHLHVAHVPKRNQQLSFVFSVAQTERRLVVELMFIDDDATQWKMIVDQQNAMIVLVRHKYVTVRVNGDVMSHAEWC